MTRFVARLIAFFHRRRLDAELADELSAHLDFAAADNLARGMSAEEARRAAALRCGGALQTAEAYRDQRGFPLLDSLTQDLRYVLRVLWKSPAFTAVAIISLALGLGATLTMFSLINGLLLRQLPVRDPGRLVELTTVTRQGRPARMSLPMLETLGERQRAFSGIFGWWGGGTFTAQVGEHRSSAGVWAVTGNFYSELGTSPQLGRLIEPQDVRLEGSAPAQVAVLGFGFWQRTFGGDPHVIDKQVRVEGVPFTIIGVTPRGFMGMAADQAPDVTIPLTAELLITPQTPAAWRAGDHLWISVGGRLEPGISLVQARAQLEAFWPSVLTTVRPPQLAGERQADFAGLRLRVDSAARGEASYLRAKFTQPLLMLMALAAIILIVACLNLAGLMLSRAVARGQEFGVRVALGAGRWQLACQALTEGLVIALAGTAIGLSIAGPVGEALRNLIMSDFLVPPALEVGLDVHVAVVAAGLACFTVVLCATIPAWRASRQDPADVLAGRSRTVSAGTTRIGKLLIATQIALSMILLLGAGLFIRSFVGLRSVNPGFDDRNRLVLALTAMPGGYRGLDKSAYYRHLVERVSAVPGVRSAGLAHERPLFPSGWTVPVSPDGGDPGQLKPAFDLVSPEFFSTLGIDVVAGRAFNWSDDEHAVPVAIVSRTLARRLKPDGDVVGQHLHVQTVPGLDEVAIVGIVNDVRLYDLRSSHFETMYVPFLQVPAFTGMPTVLVHAQGSPAAMLTAVGAAVESLGREYPLYTMTLSQSKDRALLQERIVAMLGAFFGGLTLLLAAIGLYGLMSYSVARRTRELGIRIAVGATRRSVILAVLWETLKLMLMGIAVGVPGAVAGSRLTAHLLFGLSPADPATLLLVALTLTLTGVLGGYLPARRASRIDPMVALRCE